METSCDKQDEDWTSGSKQESLGIEDVLRKKVCNSLLKDCVDGCFFSLTVQHVKFLKETCLTVGFVGHRQTLLKYWLL